MTGTYVLYDHIPLEARQVLDEIYDPRGVEIWWNTPNRLLHHYTGLHLPTQVPRDHPIAAEQLANAIADGVFF